MRLSVSNVMGTGYARIPLWKRKRAGGGGNASSVRFSFPIAKVDRGKHFCKKCIIDGYFDEKFVEVTRGTIIVFEKYC
jgi:hypothetical protein